VLRLNKNIPKVYITALSKRSELLELCDAEVKRQVWQSYPHMFKTVAKPHITSYIATVNAQAATISFEELRRIGPRGRRDNDDIKKLLGLVTPLPPVHTPSCCGVLFVFDATMPLNLMRHLERCADLLTGRLTFTRNAARLEGH